MSKYKAKRAEHNGIEFASKAERDYYIELLQKEHDGEIYGLKRQPKFLFDIDGRPLMGYKGKRQLSYVGDFSYRPKWDQGGWDDPVCVDVKGWPTPEFKLKWALVKHLYPEVTFLLYTKKKGLHSS